MVVPCTYEHPKFHLNDEHSGQALCGSCSSIQLPLGPDFQKHIRGYEELTSRAANCDLCRLIRQGLRREFSATCTAMMDSHDANRLDKEISNSVVFGNPFVPAIPGWVAIRGREGPVSVIDVFVSPQAYCVLVLSSELGLRTLHRDGPSPFPWQNQIPALVSDMINHTWGGQQLLYAKHTLWEDVRNHSKTETVMPSRVIDVGDSTLYGNSIFDVSDELQLIEPEKGTLGAYMALSHRWSPTAHITTTSNNIEKHRKGIQWRHLSRTFREAITVCREFGIRYLWIDSLCIIQDDETDWQRESKLMGDVYQNALCTIACHTADNNDKGFLNRTLHKSLVVLPGKGKQAFGLSLPSHFSRDIAYDSAITWRGWVLQERLLSRRIIHFLPSQIYLETQGNKVLSLETMQYQYLENAPGLDLTPMSRGRDIKTIEIGRKWPQIVTWFSRCALTKERDKLFALAGIASVIQRQLLDDYFAGLWGSSFIQDLCWVVADGRLAQKPAKPRAPTWSWASLDGPVTYLDPEKEFMGDDNRPRFNSNPAYPIFQDNARGQLRRVSEQTNSTTPIWINHPVSLCFMGIPKRLPEIGKCGKGASMLQRFPNNMVATALNLSLHEVWHRPVIMAGYIIGLAVLDFEHDDQREQQPLWYLELYTHKLLYYVLILSKSTQGSNVFQREGLGFLSYVATEDDGRVCSILGDLHSLDGKKPEEIVLI